LWKGLLFLDLRRSPLEFLVYLHDDAFEMFARTWDVCLRQEESNRDLQWMGKRWYIMIQTYFPGSPGRVVGIRSGCALLMLAVKGSGGREAGKKGFDSSRPSTWSKSVWRVTRPGGA